MEGDGCVLPGKGRHAGLISGTRVHRQRDVTGHAWGGVKGWACATWGGERRHACSVGQARRDGRAPWVLMLPFAAQPAMEAMCLHTGSSQHMPCLGAWLPCHGSPRSGARAPVGCWYLLRGPVQPRGWECWCCGDGISTAPRAWRQGSDGGVDGCRQAGMPVNSIVPASNIHRSGVKRAKGL